MKKLIFAAFAAFLATGCSNCTTEQRNAVVGHSAMQKEPVLTREDTINAMALAFAKQESNFNHDAVSPCGRWVGCLQISKICVSEANRLVGFECFFDGSDGCIDDRLDRQGSYAIFKTIQNNLNPNLDIDMAIDIWNKNAPRKYRENVKKYFQYNLLNYRTIDNFFEIKTNF